MRLHERTRATRIDNGLLETTRGLVRAPEVVVATNAWGAGWKPLSRLLTPFGSYVVLTEPVPELLAEIGWTGGEAITDCRMFLHYFRATADGRVLMGSGSGPIGFRGKIDKRFSADRGTAARAEAGLRKLLPGLATAKVEHAWGGPIDVSADHLPVFGTVPGTRMHYGAGYTGNGVGPSWLGGRSSRRSLSVWTTSGRACRSSIAASGGCLQSRSTSSAGASCGRRSSPSRRRRNPAGSPRRPRASSPHCRNGSASASGRASRATCDAWSVLERRRRYGRQRSDLSRRSGRGDARRTSLGCGTGSGSRQYAWMSTYWQRARCPALRAPPRSRCRAHARTASQRVATSTVSVMSTYSGYRDGVLRASGGRG